MCQKYKCTKLMRRRVQKRETLKIQERKTIMNGPLVCKKSREDGMQSAREALGSDRGEGKESTG